MAKSGARRHLSPVDLPKPVAYSHAVQAGNLLFISGQVGLDAQRHLVGPGDVATQARQALENIGRLLAAANSSWTDVAKLTIYLTDIRHIDLVRTIRAEQYAQLGIQPPATTTVAVTALATSGALIEIEAMAVLGMTG